MSNGDCVPPFFSTKLPGTQSKRCGFTWRKKMNSRICRCCGEPMPEKGNPLSRNPNICASCSSMADGMEELPMPEVAGLTLGQDQTPETIEADIRYHLKEKAA
jgi:hypothetical protein